MPQRQTAPCPSPEAPPAHRTGARAPRRAGSGKTLAFVLPAFVHVLEQPSPHTSPRALIVAPTRELAVQIHDQCLAFGRDRVVSAVCYGGAQRHRQASCRPALPCA